MVSPALGWSQRGFIAIGPTAVLIWEPGQPKDRGAGVGAEGGYRIGNRLTLVGGGSVVRMEHGQIEADYRHWQMDLGLRARLPTMTRLQPLLGGGISLQTGRRDREGRTPVPDNIGLGGHLSLGVAATLSRRFGIAAIAEAGQTWVSVGRVESGDWVRIQGSAGDVAYTRARILMMLHL